MFRVAIALVLASVACAPDPLNAQTHAVKLNGHTFTLPEGFTIELAAGAGLAPRPIVCDFDDKGRLYVCDSSGSNEKVAVQVETKPHRVVRLEDTNGDGTFDKQTVFVKNVMFPEGCLWLNGSLLVAAPPHIWKFTDTDNDGVADKEEVWFDGKTLTGCANDLHGPYRGPDGWIYWCKGAFAKQEYTLPGGKKMTTRASHIFRATPDGKNIEPVMTGGMDNPVDLVFTPGGDIIFDTTFFQHPANGKRDGLIHAVYGAVYGKDHDPVYEHPWTHPTLTPPMTHLGPAAPCGLHRLESDQFGPDYANNIFCCQFNMRKVSRHVLVSTGSTYTTKDSDFVVSDNIDFHPTDVIEDADGSLLIVDTGGWYKLCCPTSQLVKPDVTGAIYRVKRVGAHKVPDPRGLKLDWAKLDEAGLGKLLHDPRPAVRARVAAEAAKFDKVTPFNVAVCALTSGTTEYGILAATWLLAHDESNDALGLAAGLTHDPREEVRKAALHTLGYLAPFVDNHSHQIGKRLADRSPAVRRVAAMGAGRTKDSSHIPDIFTALTDDKNDRELDHALTYALIELGRPKETREGLTHASPRVRRAALAALENIPDANLSPKDVLAHLDAADEALRDTAWWVAGRHPQWGDHLAGYFKEKLKAGDKLTPADRNDLVARLVKFAGNAAVQDVLTAALKTAPRDGRLAAVRAITRAGLKTPPASWAKLLAQLPLDDLELVREHLAALRLTPPAPAEYNLMRIAAAAHKLDTAKAFPEELTLGVLAAAPSGLAMADAEFKAALAGVDRDAPAAVRSAAADALNRRGLSAAQLSALAGALKSANPLELPKLFGVFAKSTDAQVGLALAAALRDPTVRPSVRAELVKPLLDKYPAAVQVEAEKLYAELAEARKGETARLDKLLAELKPGDIRRGQLVFNSAKTQCIACHKVGYVGGTAGPDLTRIGGIRSERDLLEAIVLPSASFVRSYEPVRVLTGDERTLNGTLKKDAPDEIIVIVAADKEERVARADVASITPSSVSLMPSGLDQQLTPQDLADLVAFLRACK